MAGGEDMGDSLYDIYRFTSICVMERVVVVPVLH
jgi:hypothetical protein